VIPSNATKRISSLPANLVERAAALRSVSRPGYTLIELAIVLVILGMVASIGVPPLSALSRRMRTDVAANSFAADLRLARSEALKRNRSVFVAKTGSNTYNVEFLGNRSLQEGAAFGAGAPDTVRFAAFGPVTGGGVSYSIRVGNLTQTVTVNVSGHARVQ
jgi:prepilin-type N-terminal cleavage/methylation domain-containing protein